MKFTEHTIHTLLQKQQNYRAESYAEEAYSDAEVTALKKLASDELALTLDWTAYAISDDSVHKFKKNVGYTAVTLSYEGHHITPHIILFNSHSIELIQLSISYYPTRIALNCMGLASFIAHKHGFNLKSATLLCINQPLNESKYKSHQYGLFKSIAMTKRVKKIAQRISLLHPHLLEKEKELADHQQFLDHFQTTDIACLINFPYKQKVTLYNQGIHTFKDISKATLPLSAIQQRQCDVEISQKPYINLNELRLFFNSITSTVHFFDSEACQFPIPVLFTKKPFETFPFSFSVHTLNHVRNDLTHNEAFFYPDTDFRRAFAEALISYLNHGNSIIVYDATMEKKLLQNFALLFPDLAEDLNKIILNIKDIAPLFLNHHIILPGMKGKRSIKYIIEAIQTHNPYHDLAIQSGFYAAHTYKQLFYNPSSDRELIKNNLCNYCALDTENLVAIFKFLFTFIQKK